MVEKKDKVDIKKLKTTIEEVIRKHKSQVRTKDLKADVTEYTVTTKEATLVIKLGPKWVGYELSVSKGVLGTRRNIGTFEDTDLYPLDFDTRVTMEIFESVKSCLEGLIEGNIYAGFIDGKPTLAIPQGNGRFKVLKMGRIITNRLEFTNKELAQIEQLRSVK